MSQEKFVEFYQDYLPKHDDTKKKLDGCKNRDDFTRVALEEGKKAGFAFEQADVEHVMGASMGVSGVKGLKVNVAAVTSGVVSHELSDDQLGAVAGGQKAEKHYSGCCW